MSIIVIVESKSKSEIRCPGISFEKKLGLIVRLNFNNIPSLSDTMFESDLRREFYGNFLNGAKICFIKGRVINITFKSTIEFHHNMRRFLFSHYCKQKVEIFRM